ncbi:MAG: hypothetical protein ACW99A_07365 [Candidatus Kariarchaeaceae archaeon]|jgi:hypothetical protein
MPGWEIIKDIENEFAYFRDHSAFFIRERLYKGSNVYGNGLRPIHLKMVELVEKTQSNPVPKVYLEMKNDDFSLHVTKLKDTIQLLNFMVNSDGDNDEVNKLFSVIEMEIQDLDSFLALGYTFDPDSIISDDEIAVHRIFDLGLKIEDNFNQLSSSNEWRRRKTESHHDQEINFEELELLIEKAKNYALLNTSEDYLGILSIMAINVRDIAASNLSKLEETLLFYVTVGQILCDDLNFDNDGNTITSKFVKDDIEHKVNLKNMQWLINVHNSIVEEYPEEKYAEKFAVLLYKLSRDAKEEFLWTMLRLAREQRNEELEDVSIAYANLASMLLSVNDSLMAAGMEELANAITQAEEIKALDAIDDLAEIYSQNSVGTGKLVKAIKKQLDNLKILAYQIIQMEDIRPTFRMIVQFTDMESNLDSGRTLEDYIDSIGKSGNNNT